MYDDPDDEIDGESSEMPELDKDGDGLDHPLIGDEDSEEDVDLRTAKVGENMLKKTKKKHYKLHPITRTIGIKLNSAEKYFLKLAINKY